MFLHIDGFDQYQSGSSDPSLPYLLSGTTSIGTTAGRFGAGALEVSSYNASVSYVLPTSQTEVWMSFAMENTQFNSEALVGNFTHPNGAQASITYNPSTGTWKLYRGALSTLLGTGTAAIGINLWHWIDIHYLIDPSAGVFELWVDGVQIINVTGANTTQSGVTSFAGWEWGGAGLNNTLEATYDDFCILNTTGGRTTRIGDSRVETLVPTSDATPNDGTPTSGVNHYAMVDEAQNDGGTTTLTLTNTSGQEEAFGMASLSGTPSTVYAVKVSVIAEKSDAGDANLETVVSSSGTVSNGASTPLTTGFAVVGNIYETDPHTSAAWAYTAVNAAECGFRVP